MSNQKQYTFTQRIINARKQKKSTMIAEGRGRTLKGQVFPRVGCSATVCIWREGHMRYGQFDVAQSYLVSKNRKVIGVTDTLIISVIR